MTETGNIFDVSSLIDSGKELSKDEFVAELVPKIQAILDIEFPNNPQKRKIKVYRDRINFAAPCCGDSATDNHKKRGNIILEGRFRNMYKCHNCGTCMSVYSFLKRYGQNLSLESINYVAAAKRDFVSACASSGESFMNSIYDTETINALSFDREEFKRVLDLEECDSPNEAHQYLVGRKQYDFSKFLYSVKYKKLFILNLTDCGKIFGFQVRSLDRNFKGPKYKTYSISKIWSTIFGKTVAVPDEIEEMSMIFNILRINYALPVTVTEGPMDSFLIKNSIALLGAGKHVDFPFYHRYMFDDDEAGRKHAIEHLNNGDEVFMWSRYRNDAGIPAQKKWDMNDVVLWADRTGATLPRLDEYFSADELDIMDL